MRRIASVYLSGPERWSPEGPDLIARQRRACESAGVAPLFAGDTPLVEREGTEAMAREAYAGALASLRQADAVIVNLTPWRGPSAHPTAIFEAGFASALGKPVFAYMNVADPDDAEYAARVDSLIGSTLGEDGVARDVDGCEIEDFGLPETLMLWAEARRFFCIVTPDPLADVTGVELCLEAMKAYAD
jgi:nucleoside 2-deoxyribosyltransferase